MKLLSVLLGLGLAGAGLAAPAVQYQVITTEDGIPLMRTHVVRVDVADTNAANAVSFPYLSSTKLSQYATDVFELLRLPVRKLRLSPVFAADAGRAKVVADPNGDLVGVSYGGKHHGKGGRHSSKGFRPYPRLDLRDCLPFLVLAVSLSALVACSFLRGSACKTDFEPIFDSALAEKGIRPHGAETPQSIEDEVEELDSAAQATMDRL